MKTARLMAALTLSILPAAIASAALPSVQGLWLTDDRKGVVQIAPCGREMCGTIYKVLDRSPGALDHDANNPDPKLRSRPMVGLQTLSGFTGAGGSWKGGRAYDPKSGKSYRSTLELQPDGALKVSGCILFICEARRWTRLR
ncbi:MAG: hypothetical protein JWO25_197 [Alphaproteobacteria bacterium]|nr:hypothetical protein [Alphaproteobacteria bacterium]MDB5722880.1 hypothetical protein [Alphaproteobacteria bacterium]